MAGTTIEYATHPKQLLTCHGFRNGSVALHTNSAIYKLNSAQTCQTNATFQKAFITNAAFATTKDINTIKLALFFCRLCRANNRRNFTFLQNLRIFKVFIIEFLNFLFYFNFLQIFFMKSTFLHFLLHYLLILYVFKHCCQIFCHKKMYMLFFFAFISNFSLLSFIAYDWQCLILNEIDLLTRVLHFTEKLLHFCYWLVGIL